MKGRQAWFLKAGSVVLAVLLAVLVLPSNGVTGMDAYSASPVGASSLVVTVVDGQEQPVEGVTVTLFEFRHPDTFDHLMTGKTDTNGEIVFGNMKVDATYMLESKPTQTLAAFETDTFSYYEGQSITIRPGLRGWTSDITGIADKPLTHWSQDYDNFTVIGGSSIQIPIRSENFLWNGPQERLNSDLLEYYGITIGYRVISGREYIGHSVMVQTAVEGSELGNPSLYIWTYPLNDYTPREFELEVYLLQNRVIAEGSRTTIKGTITARTITAAVERELGSSQYESLSNLEVQPNSVLRLSLDHNDFEWLAEPLKLTTELLEQSEFQAKKKISSGADVIDSVELEDTLEGVDIVITFGAPTVDKPFHFQIYMARRSARTGLISPEITGIVKGTGVEEGNSGNGNNTGGGGGGSSSSKSSSGGGGGGRSLISSGGPFNPGGKAAASTVSASAVDKEWAVGQVKQAVQSADGSAVVRAKNAADITLEIMQEMVKTAGTTPLRMHADSMNETGDAVDVRVSIEPGKATKSVNLHASTLSQQAKKVKAAFNKYFSNTVMVVSMSQQGDFGMTVEVAVKLDKDLDKDSLLFYSYDSGANVYQQLADTAYSVDANGYVHFFTSQAGDIVVTDRPLALK